MRDLSSLLKDEFIAGCKIPVRKDPYRPRKIKKIMYDAAENDGKYEYSFPLPTFVRFHKTSLNPPPLISLEIARPLPLNTLHNLRIVADLV